jgi:THO complex subunit 4
MTSALDMSLDDLIKNKKLVGRGVGVGGRAGRGGGVRGGAGNNVAVSDGGDGGGTTGPARRQVTRSAARPTPYATAKVSRYKESKTKIATAFGLAPHCS